MEIEQGDLVVTPAGNIKEAKGIGGVLVGVVDFEVGNRYLTKDDLVKLNAPLRVKVDEPWEAECLVALAEENGFKIQKGLGYDDGLEVESGVFIFINMKYAITMADHDLTFESDYQQIKRWLKYHSNDKITEEHLENARKIMKDNSQYHGESEDGCERCNGEGIVPPKEERPDKTILITPCPNCTDDSEETETLVNDVPNKPGYVSSEQSDDSSEPRPVTLDDVRGLCDHIDELQQELEDVREERDSAIQGRKIMKDNYDAVQSEKRKLMGERDNLRERIEEVEAVLRYERRRRR